jgi:uncharacterized protein
VAFLLDVNLIIARTDPRHEHHNRAVRWLERHADELLVTCPLTENGFVRIYGHPNYPGGPGSPAEAMVELRYLRALPAHRFIEDSLSLADTEVFSDLVGVAARQLSDVYLLGLAAYHGIKFATIDAKVPVHLVRGGTEALEVIPE